MTRFLGPSHLSHSTSISVLSPVSALSLAVVDRAFASQVLSLLRVQLPAEYPISTPAFHIAARGLDLARVSFRHIHLLVNQNHPYHLNKWWNFPSRPNWPRHAWRYVMPSVVTYSYVPSSRNLVVLVSAAPRNTSARTLFQNSSNAVTKIAVTVTFKGHSIHEKVKSSQFIPSSFPIRDSTEEPVRHFHAAPFLGANLTQINPAVVRPSRSQERAQYPFKT